MKLFEKKTNWIVLATYNCDGNDMIIFVRRGLKSGMLYFKVKNTSPLGKCSYNFRSASLVDIKTQFNIITSPQTHQP